MCYYECYYINVLLHPTSRNNYYIFFSYFCQYLYYHYYCKKIAHTTHCRCAINRDLWILSDWNGVFFVKIKLNLSLSRKINILFFCRSKNSRRRCGLHKNIRIKKEI